MPIEGFDYKAFAASMTEQAKELVPKELKDHEKEYIVTVNKPVTDFFVRGLSGGVPLVELGTTTRPCRVEKIGKKQFRIVLTGRFVGCVSILAIV